MATNGEGFSPLTAKRFLISVGLAMACVSLAAIPAHSATTAVTADSATHVSQTQVTVQGTVTCDPGDDFTAHVQVDQSKSTATGLDKGTCTGSPEPFQAIVDAKAPNVFKTGFPAKVTVTVADPAPKTTDVRVFDI